MFFPWSFEKKCFLLNLFDEINVFFNDLLAKFAFFSAILQINSHFLWPFHEFCIFMQSFYKICILPAIFWQNLCFIRIFRWNQCFICNLLVIFSVVFCWNWHFFYNFLIKSNFFLRSFDEIEGFFSHDILTKLALYLQSFHKICVLSSIFRRNWCLTMIFRWNWCFFCNPFIKFTFFSCFDKICFFFLWFIHEIYISLWAKLYIVCTKLYYSSVQAFRTKFIHYTSKSYQSSYANSIKYFLSLKPENKYREKKNQSVI